MTRKEWRAVVITYCDACGQQSSGTTYGFTGLNGNMYHACDRRDATGARCYDIVKAKVFLEKHLGFPLSQPEYKAPEGIETKAYEVS